MSCYPFIEAEKAQRRNVKRACELLKVSRAACYAARGGQPSGRDREDGGLTVLIKAEHKRSRGRYGAPRIHAELRRKGHRHSRKRIARLMRQAGLAGKAPCRWKKTTIPDPAAVARADAIRRDFTADAARITQQWCGDITYLATWEGWLYLLVTWNHLGVPSRFRRAVRDSVPASRWRRGSAGMSVIRAWDRWPVLGRHERAAEWLSIWVDLGRAPRTIDAYARGLAEYLEACERHGVDPVAASRAEVAAFVRELRTRPSRRGANVVALDSGAGLSNATLQQRLVPVRLFYDFLVEEGIRESNPVGRGRYTSGRRFGGASSSGRALVPRMATLPWIPSEAEWLQVLEVFRNEPVRNRVMLAMAYDAALRREELCSLRTDDLDPAHRMLRVRAETTKTRRERVVPYSAPTGALLGEYLRHRATVSRARGALFLSESRRNHAEPLSLWSWSKVVRRVALEAGVPRFSTHTTRHLCLTDLARLGWEVHAIATFAGHRSTDSTLQYIHLSGRELAAKLNSSMAQVHAWRVAMLGEAGAAGPGRSAQ